MPRIMSYLGEGKKKKKNHHIQTHPSEFGAHVLRFFDEASLEKVFGALGIDEAVSCVQGLSLVHPASRLPDIPSMLWEKKQPQCSTVSIK